MKQLSLGILAHVDAGKTTLSEALLLESGMIRKAGRVDHGDAFLDLYAQERARGITIFSKQAVLEMEDLRITLLDTPGHVDFSAETERVLGVLDAAILVISGSDGVQSHTKTLWKLLERYHIPVFVFFNKMDLPETDREELLSGVRKEFEGNFVDFTQDLDTDAAREELAVCDDKLTERYLTLGDPVTEEEIRLLIGQRKLFPCFFGSALHQDGVGKLLELAGRYAPVPAYGEKFGAKVFKITRDEKQARLTFLKITGGSLAVRTQIPEYEEKIDQIRLYSGGGYTSLREAEPGAVIAVTGLSRSKIGDTLGEEKNRQEPVLEPVLTYRVLIPEGMDARQTLSMLQKLEEEDPSLAVLWEEEKRELRVRLMGEVQTEILTETVRERFGVKIGFAEGSILYRETIADTVEGIGHFEPLRHYAEVHLILSPGEPGSGITLEDACEPDTLSGHWRNLILTHLTEKRFKGVLTGSPVTDLKITLASGKAHLKHTESGDFRQAAFRAVRNGLMQAENVLLEPWYAFTLTIPESLVGKAMTDLKRMGAEFGLSEHGAAGSSVLTGFVPASESVNYADEVRKYTRGKDGSSFAFRITGPAIMRRR